MRQRVPRVVDDGERRMWVVVQQVDGRGVAHRRVESSGDDRHRARRRPRPIWASAPTARRCARLPPGRRAQRTGRRTARSARASPGSGPRSSHGTPHRRGRRSHGRPCAPGCRARPAATGRPAPARPPAPGVAPPSPARSTRRGSVRPAGSRSRRPPRPRRRAAHRGRRRHFAACRRRSIPSLAGPGRSAAGQRASCERRLEARLRLAMVHAGTVEYQHRASRPVFDVVHHSGTLPPRPVAEHVLAAPVDGGRHRPSATSGHIGPPDGVIFRSHTTADVNVGGAP